MNILNSIKETVVTNLKGEEKKQDQDSSKLQLNQTQLVFDEYDPDLRPPKLKVCQEHYLANRVARPKKMQSANDQLSLCPCCGNQIENTQLEYLCDIKELGFLGTGIPMFFEFIKFCMIVSFLVIVTTAGYQFSTNPSGEGCDNYEILTGVQCPDFVQNMVSTENLRGEEINTTHSLLHLVASILMMIYTLRFRNQLEYLQVAIDSSHLTPSDFAVKVKGYPRNTTEAEIKDHLTHCLKTNRNAKGIELEVTDVVLAYDITQYSNLTKEKQEFQRQQNRLLTQKSKGVQNLDEKIQDIGNLIKTVEKQIQKVIEKSRDVNGGIQFQSCGTAFVSFQKDQYCDFVITNFSKSNIEAIFEKMFCPSNKGFQKNGQLHTISIQRASEPTDVNWENLAISNWEKMKFRLYTILGSSVAIVVSFGFIFLFSYIQFIIQETGDTSYTAQILSIAASFSIVALNGGLSIVVRKLTNYEKHSTQTNYQASLAKKLGFAQFINTAIVSVIVNLAFNEQNYMVTGGLISDISWILIINTILPPLLNIFNPYHMKKFYQKKKITEQLENRQECHLTQQQANDIFKGPDYDLAKQYASVVKIMLSSAFFFYLIPYASILSLVALAIFYWQNKIQLLRRSSKPKAIGIQMSEQMVDFYLELIILVHAIGCIYFEAAIFDTITSYTIMQLVLAIIFYLFPVHKIFTSCIQVERPNTIDTYDQVFPFFTTDYGRQNPITQAEATKKWLDKQGLQMDENNTKSQQNNGIFGAIQNIAQSGIQQGKQFIQNVTGMGQNFQVIQQQKRMQMMQMARMQQQNMFFRQQMQQQRQNSTQQQQQNNFQLLQQRQQMLGQMMGMRVQPLQQQQYNYQQTQTQQPLIQQNQHPRLSQIQPNNPMPQQQQINISQQQQQQQQIMNSQRQQQQQQQIINSQRQSQQGQYQQMNYQQPQGQFQPQYIQPQQGPQVIQMQMPQQPYNPMPQQGQQQYQQQQFQQQQVQQPPQ